MHLVLVDYRRGSCERGRMVETEVTSSVNSGCSVAIPSAQSRYITAHSKGSLPLIDWRKGRLGGRGGKIRRRLRLDRRRDRRSLDLLSGENRR